MKVVQLLDKSHARESFDCGSVALNQFLKQTARQHVQKGISRTFVLIDSDHPQEIIGFFTLTLCEVRIQELSPKWAKKYPPIVSGIKLARLAVDQNWQAKGIGGILIVEAMRRAIVVAKNAGGIGLFVDAKDEAAKNFYLRYGFESLESSALQMFLPMLAVESFLNSQS
ncbi:GNAT family N-acetyltransferase [cyanobacterium TDX16]|nr:GNAT family N-acetyltransferase [cyanobacterium TDX16]